MKIADCFSAEFNFQNPISLLFKAMAIIIFVARVKIRIFVEVLNHIQMHQTFT